MDQKNKLEFVEMYEVAELSPLWVDNENGEAIMHGLPKHGFYADKHFLYYHNKGMGKAFYEKHEMEKSAKQAFAVLSDQSKLNSFVAKIEDCIKDIQKHISVVVNINFEELGLTELTNYVQKQLDLDLEIFTLYDVTQPQNFTLFEKEIRLALEEKIDDSAEVEKVIGILTGSHKSNAVSDEELEWLKIIAKVKGSNKFVSKVDLAYTNPHIYKQIHSHFEKYKLLTLGDGHWEPNIDHFLDNFEMDQGRDLGSIESRIHELETSMSRVIEERNKLIDKYMIDKQTVYYCDLIAEIGHQRFMMRTDGFIPLAFANGPFLTIASQLELDVAELSYLSVNELLSFLKHPTESMVNELKDRKKNDTYLMVIEGDKRCFFYGDKAKQEYNKRVETEDYSGIKEFSGNTAMVGKVNGKALVFQWGEDLQEAIGNIKEETILIAGQTRPQLMPLIRACVGIVTDEGGVTSHAAIVARELKMPCVVGTKVATKVLKTGDKIELDADNGKVKLL